MASGSVGGAGRQGERSRRGTLGLCLLLASLPFFGAGELWSAEEGCPPSEEILERLEALNLERASRTALFEQEPPRGLYRKAVGKPGKTVGERNGLKAHGVLLTSLPVEDLWKAVNDEEHHAWGDYLPLKDSRVVDGEAGGIRRLVYQQFRWAGVGRWWIDELEMNTALYEDSEGALWEMRWRDLMSEPEGEKLPEGVPDPRVGPIDTSVGAWLLIPLGESCTLVEFYTRSDPGGFLSVLQWLGAGRVVRNTVTGMVRLATEHIPEPHPGARFILPDGAPMEDDAEEQVGED